MVEILLDRGAPILSKTKVATIMINLGDAALLRIGNKRSQTRHVFMAEEKKEESRIDHILVETYQIFLITQICLFKLVLLTPQSDLKSVTQSESRSVVVAVVLSHCLHNVCATSPEQHVFAA